MVRICSIVVAGGIGSRMGSDVPKQLQVVAGRRILDWAVGALRAFSDDVVIVAHRDLVDEHAHPDAVVVPGGSSRADSVRAGLEAASAFVPTHVLIHDAARPAVSAEVVGRVVASLEQGHTAVIPVIPVTDSLRRIDGGSVDRSSFCAVQTPQGFEIDLINRAHAGGNDATDDASLVDALGEPVVHVEGDPANIKVTVASDLARAAILLG